MSSTEFLEWNAYQEWEAEHGFHREDYHFAELTAEVRRSFVRHPARVKASDFRLRFKSRERPTAITEEQLAANIQRSKQYWTALTQTSQKPPPRKK